MELTSVYSKESVKHLPRVRQLTVYYITRSQC